MSAIRLAMVPSELTSKKVHELVNSEFGRGCGGNSTHGSSARNAYEHLTTTFDDIKWELGPELENVTQLSRNDPKNDIDSKINRRLICGTP